MRRQSGRRAPRRTIGCDRDASLESRDCGRGVDFVTQEELTQVAIELLERPGLLQDLGTCRRVAVVDRVRHPGLEYVLLAAVMHLVVR